MGLYLGETACFHDTCKFLWGIKCIYRLGQIGIRKIRLSDNLCDRRHKFRGITIVDWQKPALFRLCQFKTEESPSRLENPSNLFQDSDRIRDIPHAEGYSYNIECVVRKG